jgi:hypothetical protein
MEGRFPIRNGHYADALALEAELQQVLLCRLVVDDENGVTSDTDPS